MKSSKISCVRPVNNVISALNQRFIWLDCLKFLAIVAVAIDHCNNFFYSNQMFWMASWYSVSLFILCSGCGVFYNRNRKRSYIHYVSKVSSFLLQYAIATFFVLIFDSKGFDLKTYINHVLNFSAQGPYYFVLFYIQLVLVTPILITWYNFCEIRKSSIIYHIITLGVITVLSSLSIKYTFMLNVHGGGKNLLGGTYFLLS